jgi:hypothetical protein
MIATKYNTKKKDIDDPKDEHRYLGATQIINKDGEIGYKERWSRNYLSNAQLVSKLNTISENNGLLSTVKFNKEYTSAKITMLSFDIDHDVDMEHLQSVANKYNGYLNTSGKKGAHIRIPVKPIILTIKANEENSINPEFAKPYAAALIRLGKEVVGDNIDEAVCRLKGLLRIPFAKRSNAKMPGEEILFDERSQYLTDIYLKEYDINSDLRNKFMEYYNEETEKYNKMIEGKKYYKSNSKNNIEDEDILSLLKEVGATFTSNGLNFTNPMRTDKSPGCYIPGDCNYGFMDGGEFINIIDVKKYFRLWEEPKTNMGTEEELSEKSKVNPSKFYLSNNEPGNITVDFKRAYRIKSTDRGINSTYIYFDENKTLLIKEKGNQIVKEGCKRKKVIIKGPQGGESTEWKEVELGEDKYEQELRLNHIAKLFNEDGTAFKLVIDEDENGLPITEVKDLQFGSREIEPLMNVGFKEYMLVNNIIDTNAKPIHKIIFNNGKIYQNESTKDILSSIEEDGLLEFKLPNSRNFTNSLISYCKNNGLIKKIDGVPCDGYFGKWEDNELRLTLWIKDNEVPIIKPSKGELIKSIRLFSTLWELYPGRQEIFNTVHRVGIMAPLNFYIKQLGRFLTGYYLHGISKTSKSSLIDEVLIGYNPFYDEKNLRPASTARSIAQYAGRVRLNTGLLHIEEASELFNEKSNMDELIKNGIEHKEIRETMPRSGKAVDGYVSIQYNLPVFSANDEIKIGTTGTDRRIKQIDLNIEDKPSATDKGKFKVIVGNTTRHNPIFKELLPIHYYYADYIQNNLDILDEIDDNGECHQLHYTIINEIIREIREELTLEEKNSLESLRDDYINFDEIDNKPRETNLIEEVISQMKKDYQKQIQVTGGEYALMGRKVDYELNEHEEIVEIGDNKFNDWEYFLNIIEETRIDYLRLSKTHNKIIFKAGLKIGNNKISVNDLAQALILKHSQNDDYKNMARDTSKSSGTTRGILLNKEFFGDWFK